MKLSRPAAGVCLLATPVIAGAWWIDHRPDVTEHPSRTASTRLDILQRDPLVAEVAKFLGQTPTITRYQCRDTPDGRRPPAVVAGFGRDLAPVDAARLGRATGWRTVSGTWSAMQLQKSFGTWQSDAIVSAVPGGVSIELDASTDDACP